MSKETPEVGDVFEAEDGTKLHIIKVKNKDEYEVYCQNADDVWIVNMEFLENYEYIGKAKGSISALFEVQDEH